MLKNYLKIALRNIQKQKMQSFISILGLALGMACFFLIFLFVRFELSFDGFHEKRDDIYRVNQEWIYHGEHITSAWTPCEIGRALHEEFPEVVDAARLYRLFNTNLIVKHSRNTFFESRHTLIDPSFFQLFSFPVIHGNSEMFYNDLHSVVISHRAAEKYFGRQNPVGQTININQDMDFTVSGVVQIPENTEFEYDLFFPIKTFEEEISSGWGALMYKTFIQLKKGVSLQSVQQKIWALQKKHIPEESEKSGLRFQKLSRIHLYRADETPGEMVKYIIIFGIGGIFILLIACINFVNLSTARSEQRAREVGLRKTIGAERMQIITQFALESFLISTMAFVCAVGIVALFLPAYNMLIGTRLALNLSNIDILSGLIGAWLLTAAVSGGYPSLFLSSFRPIQILRGRFIQGKKGGRFRKGLVIFQFILSIFFIISTVTVFSQLKYIETRYQSMDKGHLIYLRMDGGSDKRGLVLKEALLKYAEIQNATVTQQMPLYMTYSRNIWSSRSKAPETRLDLNYNMADFDYIKTFNMEIIEGRDFSEKNRTDGINCILNEEAVRQLGIQNPVGKEIVYWDGKVGKIIGIVRDFNYRHVSRSIGALVLCARPDWHSNKKLLVIRLASGEMKAAMDIVRREWKEINPGIPLNVHFFDEAYDQIYRNEQTMSKLFTYFAVMTIFISCLGLFGLASFMAERRIKEIGIRKTLGATFSQIAGLMVKDFLLLVAVSNLIAWPVAYYFMHRWLQNFAYRTNMTIWIFLFSGMAALLIAVLTVSYQTIRAARANPVESLRYE